ncbi:MAG: polyprenyl synthetase family protein, partial [Methanothrix sp.]|nr:polyprenyl synthetase family protein [Methanothrix sp.]
MNNIEYDPLFSEYALPVIEKLQAEELSSTFSDCTSYLISRLQSMPAWQIALPVIASVAAGGSIDDGVILASAWVSLNLASEILDNVEDNELTVDQFLTSPEVASNIATGLIFTSFHTLTSIQDANKANLITRVLSNCGLDATYGQHRDLIQERLSVELVLNNYWENIILKSGSVFRAATQGGAVVAGANETITDALGDYGTALGVILQLFDDCRDAFNHSEETINWEISLPLLLYLLTVGEKNIVFPKINSRAEWSDLLQKAGVIQSIAEL